MAKTREKDVYSITELADLLGITSWDSLEDKNPDAWGEHYSHAYRGAIQEGSSEEKAEEVALEAESEARDEDYRKWKSALLSAVSKYLGYHHLDYQENERKGTFKIIAPQGWDQAAEAIRETINGVGYFHFNSLKEFKDSIPVRSSRQLVLGHLHWIKDYGRVYGEASPERLMENWSRRKNRRNPVDPSDSRWLPASEADKYNPERYDFRWNADYTKFIPIRLAWWDDASYKAYQGDHYGPEDYEDVNKKSRRKFGRSRQNPKTRVMSLRQARALLKRKRKPGRPTKNMSRKLAAARRALKIRRYNPDEEVRAVERKYEEEPSKENLDRVVALRQRSGLSLPEIISSQPRLEWGYHRGLPARVQTAWGARAILTNRMADIVYQSWTGPVEEREALSAKLNAGLLREMQNEIRRLGYNLRSDEDKEHLLVDDQGIVILGNTNASHGYLYLVAFEKPPGWVGPSKYVAPPPPPPPAPLAPESARKVYGQVLEGSAWEPERLKPGMVQFVVSNAKSMLKNKTGAKTPKAFFDWLLQQHLTPETRTVLEAALKEAGLSKRYRLQRYNPIEDDVIDYGLEDDVG